MSEDLSSLVNSLVTEAGAAARLSTAAAVRARGKRRATRQRIATATLSLVLLRTAGGASAATRHDGPAPPPVAVSPTAISAPCASRVLTDALPHWARGGFTGTGAGVPHVFSEHGDLIAVLFGYPPLASA